MTTSDWLLTALNVATLLLAVVGMTAQHLDPMSLALALAFVTTLLNGAVLLRRGSRRPVGPPRVKAPEPNLELDARQLLDIDQRLEVLERRDDVILRQLVASGKMAGSDAPLLAAPGGHETGPSRREATPLVDGR